MGSDKKTYKPLTFEDFKKGIVDLYGKKDGLSPRREMIFFTGTQGANQLELAMLIENARDMLKWLVEQNAIPDEDYTGLIKMIESNDYESIQLAITILEVKKEEIKTRNINNLLENGTTVHSTES